LGISFKLVAIPAQLPKSGTNPHTSVANLIIQNLK